MSHSKMETVSVSISSEILLEDCRALFDSYAVEVKKGELIFHRAPMFFSVRGMGISAALDPATEKERGVVVKEFNHLDRESFAVLAMRLNAPLDRTLDVTLVEYSPAQKADDPPSRRRWPFFVASSFAVFVSVGDQWWVFKFSPGNLYTERVVVV